MSVFEAGMLICFGISWPVSIAKALRTKQVVGKSPVFMAIVCLGYLSGILHKVLVDYDWVIALYVLNLAMVAFDLFLYYRYLNLARGLHVSTDRAGG
jgi:predicted tellurium resistance membrane protein TerC